MIDAAAHGRAGRAAAILRPAGLWMVLACALLRCLVAPEPFPYWDIDPGRVVLPVTGLTPSMSVGLDVITMFAGGAALLGEVLAGFPVLLLPVMLWMLGCFGAAIHGLALRSGSVDDVRIGATWCAAMTTGLAAMHVCRDPKLKRVTIAAAIGVIAILAAKGLVQVFYEHAETVARYQRDKAAFWQSQGWMAGSVQVKNFERRLNQPEATGWFGLSNVFATFAASTCVMLTGCAILAWREARVKRKLPDGWAGVLTLGALGALGAVVLAGGKGGFTVAGLGLAMLAVFMLIQRGPASRRISARLGGILAIGVVAAALGAVVLRGMLGQRVGELSLLFRWFYLEGAARAFVETPSSMLWGTGPDGFRDAYMRLKPAMSPEEVTSPHSVLVDWGATLGVFGLAWGGLWLSWVWRLGTTIGPATEASQTSKGAVSSEPLSPIKPEGWFAVLAVSAAVLGATWFERALGSPEQAGVRLVGLAAWIGVTLAILQLLRVSSTAAAMVCVGALAAAAHCQIEVTPVWSGSTCWIALILAAAGAPTAPPRKPRREDAGLIAPVFAIGLAGVIAWLGLTRVSSWEVSLGEASEHLRPLAEVRTRWLSIQSAALLEGDSKGRLAQDLGKLTNSPEPRSDQEVEGALTKLAMKACGAAAESLSFAVVSAPRHFPTTEALCRVLMEKAGSESALGQGAQAAATETRALDVAISLANRRPTASVFGLIGNIHAAKFEASHDPAALAAAVAAWNQASTRDPYGTSFPLRIFRQLVEAGRFSEARPYATKLLEMNELLKLDPLKKLSEEELKSIRRVLGD